MFDTAFFHDLPPAAATYAIDRDVGRSSGTSAATGSTAPRTSTSASRRRRSSARRWQSLNQIVLHLGNGASASAIVGGRPVDTSMGLTPLEGLVMGTRRGDVDPGVVFHLRRTARDERRGDRDPAQPAVRACSGLGGDNDFRELHQRIEAGDAAAQLAYDVYIHRLRKYVGAYLAVLGSADVITFTAGVGENDAPCAATRSPAWRRWASSSTNISTTARARVPAGSRPTTRR